MEQNTGKSTNVASRGSLGRPLGGLWGRRGRVLGSLGPRLGVLGRSLGLGALFGRRVFFFFRVALAGQTRSALQERPKGSGRPKFVFFGGGTVCRFSGVPGP
eukprot:8993807-Pyramimonas_sp.AAC.1